MKIIFIIWSIFFLSSQALAEAQVLVVDKTAKPSTKAKHIEGVHKEIFVKGLSEDKIKYLILQGMLSTKGYAWGYEGEGEDYILARFDYRGNTVVMRIEYTDEMIQLKHHKAWGDMTCKNDIDGVCYKTAGSYYKYVRNLRKSIVKQVNSAGDEL